MMRLLALGGILYVSISYGFVTPLAPRPRHHDDKGAERRATIDYILKSASLLGLTLSVTGPRRAVASVAFDPDRYGDKELKIATVNKLKQRIRNAILKDPSLAVPFLRIAINDGLGFDAQTGDGGPDGSIGYENERAQNAGLKPAIETLYRIKQNLQRTNEEGLGIFDKGRRMKPSDDPDVPYMVLIFADVVAFAAAKAIESAGGLRVVITFADIVAFAGAEAIESVGGPRIAVQLGRYDAKGANPAREPPRGYDWEQLSGVGVRDAFTNAGLGAREGVLLYGALGAIHMAVQEAMEDKKEEKEEESDSIDEQPFIPSTFGRAEDIYGERLGNRKFDTSYLTKIYKGDSVGLAGVDKALLGEPSLKNFVQKYQGNNNAFIKDLSECYQKLSSLGFYGTNRNS